MALYFDPILNMPRQGGLTIRVSNPGDGTLTLSWSGFNLEAYDASGTWRLQYSTDGTNWSALDSPLPVGDSSYLAESEPLGELRYYRVRAFDSNTEVVRVSNTVSTTLPEPWAIGDDIRWRDFENDSITTATGIQLARASSQYLDAGAVLTALNGSATGGAIVWRKDYGTSATLQVGLITSGAPGKGYNVQGWGMTTGATNNLCVTLWTNSNGSTLRYARCNAETSLAGCLGFSFNGGTAKLFLDGVSQTVTYPAGALNATLPTSSTNLRIGYDVNYANYALYGAVIFSTEPTDEQHAYFGALPYAPAYSEIPSAMRTGILHYWPAGSLVDSVSGLTFTAPNSYSTQTGIASVACRASGETWSAYPGRLPLLDTLSGVPVVFYDGYSSSSAEYTSSPLFRALSSARFATSEGTIINFTRWPTVSSTENFHNSSVFGAVPSGGVDYLAVGHKDFSGTINAWMRLRSDTSGLVNFDGHWKSTGVVAANTNYRDVWTWDGATMEHTQNGVTKTVTAAFNGSGPYYPNQLLGQNYEGNFGASGSSCRHAYLIYFPFKLTAAQLAQVNAWLDANSL